MPEDVTMFTDETVKTTDRYVPVRRSPSASRRYVAGCWTPQSPRTCITS
jgi:hypothetical protein